jgi:mono/diheme cytochrome c family protein
MMRQLMVAGASLAMSCWTLGAHAADLAAGKAKVDEICSECHEAADWEGEDAASLEAMIKDVVSGKFKHKKKLDLTEADIANVAAYWASAANN